jgi:hypothetical protein
MTVAIEISRSNFRLGQAIGTTCSQDPEESGIEELSEKIGFGFLILK